MNKNSLDNIFSNIVFGIKSSYLASKHYFIIKLIILFLSTGISFTLIWLWKEVLNLITINDISNKFIFFLVCYFGLLLFSHIISHINNYVNTRYGEEMHFYIESIMMQKTSKVTLSFFDSAEMSDKVRHARSNFNAMTQMTWIVFDILSSLISVSITIIIVSSYRWWLGLLTIILLVPYMLYNKFYAKKMLDFEKEQLRDNRKKDYYRDIIFNPDIHFEIKLNSIGMYFYKKYIQEWKKLYLINKRENIKNKIINTLIMIINVSSDFFMLVISFYDVVNNYIGIGDLQYNLSIISKLRSQTINLINHINGFASNNLRLIELQEFMSIVPESETCGELIPSNSPKIEFDNVSFKYPNDNRYTLNKCSFVINPYEKVSLVGKNGAGKSTIIKLLFRFYDPDEGIIKIDNKDIKEYNIYAVRKVFGVLFQDYVRYCLPLREIIGLSDFDNRFDDKKLKKACDISGATQIISNWENGFDSVIGRYYADNGKDLSGGQWQLISLARAYFKDSNCMVLDEPSAALDPISENRIFEQLYYLSENKGSIMISHRLSNTTLANKILVVENGSIVEQGNHTELLEKQGLYKHWFELQAQNYM